jgi:hypothetical protein
MVKNCSFAVLFVHAVGEQQIRTSDKMRCGANHLWRNSSQIGQNNAIRHRATDGFRAGPAKRNGGKAAQRRG